MENRISQDQMARAAQLQKTMTELRRKREKTFEDRKQETLVALDDTLRVDAFRRAFKNDESLLERLPRLIQTKVSELEKESAGLSEQCESLQKKINGYNHRFGEMDPKSNDAIDQ
jgi:tRNA U55 pseudouridine synthase TruB